MEQRFCGGNEARRNMRRRETTSWLVKVPSEEDRKRMHVYDVWYLHVDGNGHLDGSGDGVYVCVNV